MGVHVRVYPSCTFCPMNFYLEMPIYYLPCTKMEETVGVKILLSCVVVNLFIYSNKQQEQRMGVDITVWGRR